MCRMPGNRGLISLIHEIEWKIMAPHLKQLSQLWVPAPAASLLQMG